MSHTMYIKFLAEALLPNRITWNMPSVLKNVFSITMAAPSMSPILTPLLPPSQSQSPTSSSRPSTVEQAITYQEAKELYQPLWFEPKTNPSYDADYLNTIEFCAGL